MERHQVGAGHLGRQRKEIVPSDGKRKLTDGTVIESITFFSRSERDVPQGEVRGTTPNGSIFQVTVPLTALTDL